VSVLVIEDERKIREFLRHALFFGLGLILPLVVFALLAEDVWAREKIAWDAAVLTLVRGYVTADRDRFMVVATQLGAPTTLLLLVASVGIALLVQRRVREAIFVTVATAGAGALIIPAKLLFERARPALEHLPVGAPGYAFPSGHAAGSMALGAAVIMLAWRTSWRWGVLILASLAILLVGFSRVYLGVHYASDVLAGWCVGVSWAAGMHLVVFGVLGTDRSTTSRRAGGPDRRITASSGADARTAKRTRNSMAAPTSLNR
jgi:membrane-associated phospholipid phosphatase